MKLNFHSYRAYLECPQKFYKEFLRKEPYTVPQNDYFKLYGKLVEKFFEMFCNIWRLNTPYMPPEMIKNKLEILWDGLLSASFVNWSAPFVQLTKDDIFNQAYGDIRAIMDSQNQNHFLNTKSEVEITVSLKDGDIINGRLDFVHRSPLGDSVSIIDGKGTDKLGKNTDPTQLLFYALLYYFHFKVLPAEIGFFYYRFNSFNPIPFDLNTLNGFRAKLSCDLKRIKTEVAYAATPSSKSCKYCGYKNKCNDYFTAKAERAKPSKLKELQGDGVIEFGF
jgi:CRISPR/Cas system-associated exonuclease Cas4 (RecB family)